MNHPAIAAVCAAVFLGACSGNPSLPNTDDDDAVTTNTGTGTTATPLASTGPASVVLEGSDATRIAYDATEDEVIVESIPFDGEVRPSRYVRVTANDRGRYKAYRDADGLETYEAYRGETDSGEGSVTVVATGGYSDHGYFGAGYSRTSSVSIPSSTQKGFYTGDYVAIRTTKDGTARSDIITGRTELEVDFSDSVVRGEINTRTAVRNETTGTVDGTVIFKDAPLNRSGGDYSGTVSTNTGGSVTDVGSYNGALVGTDATETVGVVQITQGDLRETGVYTAKQ